MKRNYVRLSHQEFGKFLLASGDLDPLYIALYNSKMPSDQLKRWLVAYWCYYSAAVASRISESDNFYAEMRMLAPGTIAPRGFERRHWRGVACLKSIDSLEAFGSPETIVDSACAIANFYVLIEFAKRFYLFGDWISWKIADMLERIMCAPIDFSNAELGIYKDPVKGAAMIRFGDELHSITQVELRETVANLVELFSEYKALPRFERRVNVQEIETILCKFKSHQHGHYPLGFDTHEIFNALTPEWGEIAMLIKSNLPQIREIA